MNEKKMNGRDGEKKVNMLGLKVFEYIRTCQKVMLESTESDILEKFIVTVPK